MHITWINIIQYAYNMLVAGEPQGPQNAMSTSARHTRPKPMTQQPCGKPCHALRDFHQSHLLREHLRGKYQEVGHIFACDEQIETRIDAILPSHHFPATVPHCQGTDGENPSPSMWRPNLNGNVHSSKARSNSPRVGCPAPSHLEHPVQALRETTINDHQAWSDHDAPATCLVKWIATLSTVFQIICRTAWCLEGSRHAKCSYKCALFSWYAGIVSLHSLFQNSLSSCKHFIHFIPFQFLLSSSFYLKLRRLRGSQVRGGFYLFR